MKTKFRRPGREALLLLYYPVYIALFVLTEKLIRDNYWLSWCPLDDRIPFVRQFVLVYVLWYFLMVGMTFCLLFSDRRAFIRCASAVIAGLTASILIFFILPSAQLLRPESVPGSSLSAVLLRAIYAADTNTNVMPSMHVVGSLAAMAAARDTETLPGKWKRLVIVLGALICASTVFIKQHSLLDVLGGIALFIPIWLIVWKPYKRKEHEICDARTGK